MGYFSSNAVAPYDTNKDGFWLEDDGETKRIVVSRKGVETLNVAMADWNGDSYAQTWLEERSEYFNVILWDFLWLGGQFLGYLSKRIGDLF